ncbi:996_t:CDS:2 [Gigaspora rosea]|nr:996_t:CDS:2 [Gigaspora rosea]
MFDAQTNEIDTLNLEKNQQTKDNHMNNWFKISKKKENNKPSINVSQEQTTLANNSSTQADDIESTFM